MSDCGIATPGCLQASFYSPNTYLAWCARACARVCACVCRRRVRLLVERVCGVRVHSLFRAPWCLLMCLCVYGQGGRGAGGAGGKGGRGECVCVSALARALMLRISRSPWNHYYPADVRVMRRIVYCAARRGIPALPVAWRCSTGPHLLHSSMVIVVIQGGKRSRRVVSPHLHHVLPSPHELPRLSNSCT